MAFRSDYDVKDRVKQATDVVDLIGSFISLRRQGSSYVGLCPWHDDSRPSFQVNPGRQSWACWVCDLRGDVFDFMMRLEGIEFRPALELLAERAGISVKSSHRPVAKGSKDDKQMLYRAMQWAEAQYHECLLQSDAAIPIREYLIERGITQDSIETFRIGFAPLSWTWLIDRARNTEFSPEILEACGLVSANQRGGWYERFRGRVLFPIRDTLDRPIALGGRVVPSLYGEGEDIPPAKYVNSPETRLFSKSHNLYALNLCRSFLQKSDDKRLTIVEGYTDVIAAWQAGLRNVVAALGTAINEQHIRLIKRFADGITLVLDGDEAGQKKANSVLDLFIAQDIDLRILTLPEGLDPFDFLRDQGGEPFQAQVDAAPDAIGHKIITETRGIDLLNDSHRATQALDHVLQSLARIPQRELNRSEARKLRLDQMILRLARQFHLPSERVRNRLTEIRLSQRPLTVTQQPEPETRINYRAFNGSESELIQLLIQSPTLLDTAIENVVPDEFEAGPLQDLYRVMEEFFHDGKEVGYEQLMLELEDQRLKGLVEYLYDKAIAKKQVAQTNPTDFQSNLESQLETIIDRFRQRRDESGVQARISQIKTGQLNADEEADVLKQLFEYQVQQHRNKNPK